MLQWLANLCSETAGNASRNTVVVNRKPRDYDLHACDDSCHFIAIMNGEEYMKLFSFNLNFSLLSGFENTFIKFNN